jgi:hypothetical protein
MQQPNDISSSPAGRKSFKKSFKTLGHRLREVFRSPSPQPSFEDADRSTQALHVSPPPTNIIGPLPIVNPSQLSSTPQHLQNAKDITKEAWAGLEAALRLVEISSDVFPPLKAAIGGVLGCLDIFRVSVS